MSIFESNLRDWFAGLAMQANIGRGLSEETSAEKAYSQANHMMIQRRIRTASDFQKQLQEEKAAHDETKAVVIEKDFEITNLKAELAAKEGAK